MFISGVGIGAVLSIITLIYIIVVCCKLWGGMDMAALMMMFTAAFLKANMTLLLVGFVVGIASVFYGMFALASLLAFF
jgi:hypothetical protein